MFALLFWVYLFLPLFIHLSINHIFAGSIVELFSIDFCIHHFISRPSTQNFFPTLFALFLFYLISNIKFILSFDICNVTFNKYKVLMWIYVRSFSSISYCSNLRLISNMLFGQIHPFYTLDIHDIQRFLNRIYIKYSRSKRSM